MNAYKFILFALVLAGLGFSITYFGPGTALDCEVAGTITLSTTDVYVWNQTGATQMNFDSGALGDSCIIVSNDEITINCTTPTGKGTINGTSNTHGLIHVNPGVEGVIITGCHFANSTKTDEGAGITIGGDGDDTVSDAEIYDNFFDSNRYGIVAYNLSNSQIHHNQFGNEIENGLVVSAFSNLLVEENEFYGGCNNGYFVALYGKPGLPGSGLRFYNNTLHDSSGYGAAMIGTVEDSEVRDNEVYNIGRAGIACLDVRTTTFSGNTIYQNGLNSDNYAGLSIRPYNEDIVPENVYLLDNEIYDNNGTGIRVENLTNGNIEGNEVYGSGPGMQKNGIKLFGADSIPLVDNQIHGNSEYGAYLVDLEEVTIRANGIFSNEKGMYIGASSLAENTGVLIRDNNIYENTNGGLEINDSPLVMLDTNSIFDNGGFGASIRNSPDAFIYDNLVYRNKNLGVSLELCDDALLEYNCIYEQNVSDHIGAYIYLSDNVVFDGNDFENNIFGVLVHQSYGARIVENDFLDNYYGATVRDSDGADISVNEFDGDSYSVQLIDTSYCAVRENLVHSVLITAFYVNPAIVGSDNMLISDNHIRSSGEHSIWVSDITDSEISGNTISDSNSSAIYVRDSLSSEISGNTITGNCLDIGDGATGAIHVAESELMWINDNWVGENNCSGIYVWRTLMPTIDPNDVYRNEFYGVVVSESNFAEVYENSIYQNGYSGLYLYQSPYAQVYENRIFENAEYGAHVYDSDDGTYSDNVINDNSEYGYYIEDSDDIEFRYELIYNNGKTPGDWTYGFYAGSCNRVYIYDAELYGNDGAFYLYNSDTVELYRTVTHDHVMDDGGYYIDSSSNVYLEDCSSYNDMYSAYVYQSSNVELQNFETYNNVNGLYWEDSSGWMDQCSSHDQPSGTYAFETDNSDIEVTGLRLYSNADSYLYIDETSEVDFTDLWLGVDETYGINYGELHLGDGAITDAYDETIILNRDFISLDSANSDVDDLDAPATLTTRVSGCSNLQYYYDDSDFPQSSADIFTNGETFTPASSSCTGTAATYEVDGFTGYAAKGASLSSGGGSSYDSMAIKVSSEPTVGETVTLTITDSGPLSGVDVRLRVTVGGIYKYFDIGKTNSAGQVSFVPEYEGTYKATGTKDGYFDGELYFSVGPAEPVPECVSDSDCPKGQLCSSGKCVRAPAPPKEEPAEAPEPECTTAADCGEGMACEQGVCVESMEQAEEEPAQEQVPPEPVKEEVQPVPAAPEQPSEPPAEKPEGEGFPWLWLLLGLFAILLIGGAVYWFFMRKGAA